MRYLPRLSCSAAEHNSVILLQYAGCGYIFPDLRGTQESNPLGFHFFNTTTHYLLVEFHRRDAVHQQSAGSVIPLVYGDGVPSSVQEIRYRKA